MDEHKENKFFIHYYSSSVSPVSESNSATPHRYLVNYSPNSDTVLVLCGNLTQ